jgi:epoxide hydrolase-like predicted phosphatase
VTIKAVVFDIGGVLKKTPDLGVNANWEKKLNLKSGEIDRRLISVWEKGRVGTISEAEVNRHSSEILGISVVDGVAFMDDRWTQYLGTPNVELIEYFISLRSRRQTAILSNSFVGARKREEERYHFGEMTDLIIYSHEVGMVKPDPRIYALTCERLRLRPEEIIFLDDKEKNIASSREYGMCGILFKGNAQATSEIEDYLKG